MNDEIALGGIIKLADQRSGRRGHGAPTQAGLASAAPTLILTLLADFEREGIAYCYWKSSRRVRAALASKTDLDLLVDYADRQTVERLLAYRGYKFFRPVASRDHPALASYFGYDDLTGRLVHVHLHFNLVSGEALLRRTCTASRSCASPCGGGSFQIVCNRRSAAIA